MVFCKSIYGTAGAALIANISPNATIEGTPSPGSPRQIILDEQGLALVRVYMSQPSLSKDATLFTVQSQHSSAQASQIISFQSYHAGQSGILAYNYSTGAPNDGSTPCSIYIIAENDSQEIDVSVSGSALINGWATQTKVPVHRDGSATINVVCAEKGKVTVTVTAKENDNAPITIDMAFTDEP